MTIPQSMLSAAANRLALAVANRIASLNKSHSVTYMLIEDNLALATLDFAKLSRYADSLRHHTLTTVNGDLGAYTSYITDATITTRSIDNRVHEPYVELWAMHPAIQEFLTALLAHEKAIRVYHYDEHDDYATNAIDDLIDDVFLTFAASEHNIPRPDGDNLTYDTNPTAWRLLGDIANRCTRFTPATGIELTTNPNPDPEAADDITLPTITTGGIEIAAHFHPDGHFQITVSLDDAQPWTRRDDDRSSVPMRINVGDYRVFTN